MILFEDIKNINNKSYLILENRTEKEKAMFLSFGKNDLFEYSSKGDNICLSSSPILIGESIGIPIETSDLFFIIHDLNNNS